MAFVAIYDANVLYGNTLRDLLIRIAQTGLVQAKWTHEMNPPETIEDVLNALEKAGLVESAAALRAGRYDV